MFLPSDLSQMIDGLQVDAGQLAVFWLGQASFVFKGPGGVTVAVDPYFSDIVERLAGWRRLWDPPFPPERLRADIVVYTHDHIDHLDPVAAPIIAAAQRETVFVGPPSCADRLRRLGIASERIVTLARGEAKVVRGVPMRAVPADHKPPGDPEPHAIGIHMLIGGVSVYQTGDTIYSIEVLEAARSLGPLDLLVVPINGNYAVMNPLDAALFTQALAPIHVIPCHFGMFATNTADPYQFVAHLRSWGVAARPLVLSVGGGCVLRAAAAPAPPVGP